jgi:hypothetical protein
MIIEEISIKVVHMKIWRKVASLLVIHFRILNLTIFAMVRGLFLALCKTVVFTIIYRVGIAKRTNIVKSEIEFTNRVILSSARKICVEKMPLTSLPTSNCRL